MAKSLDHRLAEQIASYSDLDVDLPDYVKSIQQRISSVGRLDRGVSHTQSMLQSKRGHENPGPGKSVKTFGRKK